MIRRHFKAAFQKKFVRDTVMLQAASLVQSGTYLITSLITTRMLSKVEFGSLDDIARALHGLVLCRESGARKCGCLSLQQGERDR